MIWFASTDEAEPAGGIRTLYRHADILNAHGIGAAVLHEEKGFRCTWFENQTVVKSRDEAWVGPGDVLALPEVWGPGIATIMPGVRKLIYNQNPYYSFTGYTARRDLVTAYTHPDVAGATYFSEDARRYLSYAFGGVRLFELSYGIDSKLFYPVAKKRQVAFMPRKNPSHAFQVMNLLTLRGALRGWEVVTIDRMPFEATAAVLREARVFFSFGYPEGFGLPPAEAMACECVVVGYHGNGGREFFLPEHCVPMEYGDILGYAAAAERVLTEMGESEMNAMGARAGQFVREKYSMQREEKLVLDLWKGLVS